MLDDGRLYNDKDQVAVIISPNYGAGWYTWNPDYPDCLFDKDIAAALLNKDLYAAIDIASTKYPDCYSGGLEDAVVVWIDIGTKFKVIAYDGYETLQIYDSNSYLTA